MAEEARLGQTADASEAGTAPPVHLPGPSLWPAALGLGVSLVFFGFLTHWAFSVAGAVLFVVALAAWIGEIRRDASSGPADHDAHA